MPSTMEWKLFFSTFAAIFLAELGDKTQLAVLALSTDSAGRGRWVVVVASALALTATSAIAVLGGDIVARYVSPVWLKRIAGAVFVVMGLLYIVKSGAPD
jgi:putative Ca2+/H+ antiporter (TMEM165/GDT1 family)